jgi:hypothetical protein
MAIDGNDGRLRVNCPLPPASAFALCMIYVFYYDVHVLEFQGISHVARYVEATESPNSRNAYMSCAT